MTNKGKKMLMLFLGFFFAGLGALGILLPVLPTTPFLLLASYFFARGSKRFHQWFINTKLYQKHLNDLVQRRTMPLKTKWCILLPVSLMLTIAFFVCPVMIGKVLIAFAFVFKYYYFFFRIKTMEPNEVLDEIYAD